MAEVLVVGKKISEMELVTDVSGNEKIPTGVVGDRAVTTGQLLTYVNNNGVAQWGRIGGDITNQVDLQNQFTQERDTLKSYTQEQVSQQQVALQEHIDVTNEVFKYARENGSALPYKEGVSYEEGAVVVKDGELQQWKGGEWRSAVAEGLSDTIQTFNTPEAGVDPVTGVTDGAYFNVRSSSDESYVDEYQNVGGSAVATGNRYLSALGVQLQEKAASTIKDASGKDQQEINNLWNLFVNAKNDGSQDVSEIFTNYCNSLDDGDTVVIPKGEYFWDSTLGTRIIRKNINIECRGVFKVKPSGNQMLTFSGSEGAVTVPMNTATSLVKGAGSLNITAVAGVAKPEEYFVSMQSSELLSRRTGAGLENSIYTKNLTADVVSNTFRLRDQLPFGWDDLSLGTLQFIKKKRHVTIRGLRIEPTESGVFSAISTNRASNITFEDLEIAGNESNSNMVRLDLSYNIRFKQTSITDASAAAGYYAIMNNQSSYIYLDGVGYIDGEVSNRGYVARHGFKCYFTNCLLNGIDDHWGYDYYVNNCNLAIGISVAGGSLTVNNTTSMQTLVRQRTDTPYNDGKLTIKNSWGLWGLLAVAGHTTGGTYTPRKAWDYIDVVVGLFDDITARGDIISVTEPHQDIDTNLVFKETVMYIRNAVIQNNTLGRKLIGILKQRTNNSGSGTEVDWFDGTFESKRLFKKIIVDNVTTVNSGSVAISPLFEFPCATTIEVRNVDDFGFACLRAQELITDNIVIKGSNFTNPFGRIDVAEWHGSRIRTKENHTGYTWTKAFFPTPASFLSSSRLYSRTYMHRAFGDTVKSAVGMTYEVANLNNDAALTYKSRNNFVANTVYSHTFSNATVVLANGTTAEYFVSAPNNDVGNIVIGSFANGGDGLLINAYRTGHGHIKFRVKNLTEAGITIPVGSVIHFVIY